MTEFAREPQGDIPIGIATMPAKARERRLALIAILVLAGGMAITAPFATVQVGRVDAFVPALQTALCVADLITASLLLTQYAIQPHGAVLILASGYIFSGAFAFLQTLAFPGAYAPHGLFGDGIDSPAWFFILWHTTFPLSIIVYSFVKDTKRAVEARRMAASSVIGITVACVLATIVGLSFMVTAGIGYLPAMYTGGVTQQTLAANLANLAMLLMGMTAFVVLFFRRRSILDLWLMVTLFAWMPNFLVAAVITFVRFSVGWYVARGYALVASCTILIVLLTETTVLYARLVSAISLQRRERANRLISVDTATAALAHEVRQPLSQIASRGAAAMNWLKRTPPDLERAKTNVQSIIDAVHRADEIIANVRGMIKKTSTEKIALDLNALVREVLTLAEHDLQGRGVLVMTEYDGSLPQILGNRTLLQQVLHNLVRNAVEAMASTDLPARRLRLATRRDDVSSSALVTVEDSGRGISEEDRERIFDTFFTTKASGMGLGLSICRTAIEEHGGELRLTRTDPHGSTFEIMLPIGAPRDRRKGLERAA